MANRPAKITSIDNLQNYYWKKSDLIRFCKNHLLPTQGAKSDLIERIGLYLSTGNLATYKAINKQGKKDSSNCITKYTVVKNYNNDAETRKFFIEHLGATFKFNAYLRQFSDPSNIRPNMTYGDLIDGWISFENNRKKPSEKHVIASQFEYNQFMRDYFTYEKGATLAAAISAWKTLVSKRGPRTYKQFKNQKSKAD
jgi:hypothetical protein